MSDKQDKQGQPRNLNDVQFAAVIDAIVKGTFNVRATYVDKVGLNIMSYEQRAHDYTFDKCAAINAAGFPLLSFMRDVEQLVAEYVELQRLDGEVRTANKQFADENQRLNTRLNNERAANLTWEERYNAVKGKRDSLELDLKDANKAMVVLRERATGFQQELSAARSDLDEAVEQIKTLTRRNETQSESIGRYQEENEALALNVKSLMAKVEGLTNSLAAQPDTQAVTRERGLRDRIENQRTSIIEFQREMPKLVEKLTNANIQIQALTSQAEAAHESHVDNARTYLNEAIRLRERVAQLEAERAQLPPDHHVITVGDTVGVKGLAHAPKMTVTNIGEYVQCAFWCRENGRFEWANFNEGALNYFAPKTPSDAKSESAPIVRVGTSGNMELRPITVSKETLATAIKNGRQMIFGKTKDFDTLRACFDVIADEVSAHVSIG